MTEDQTKFTVTRTFTVIGDSLDDALEQTKPKGDGAECIAVSAGPYQQTRPQPPTGQAIRMQPTTPAKPASVADNPSSNVNKVTK